MNKLLSVCVPSYNMEKYLNRCIDSFLVPEILDKLEIIIVNDGGKDATLSIAQKYKTEYPQSIVVIDKPNGHYGSCVNASLKVATGKYFRIVDADDWVDSQALVEFVNTLDLIDVDCVCTKYTTHDFNNNTMMVHGHEAVFGVPLDMNLNILPHNCLHMHKLTYSLDLLRQINYTQTEGICYTDTEYSYIPLACSRDIFFIDISLYQYFIGRGDQSMAPNVLKKNYMHLVKILRRITLEHNSQLPFNANEKRIYTALLERLSFMVTPSYLMYHNYDKTIDSLLRTSIRLVQESSPNPKFLELWDCTILKVPYVSIWYSLPSLSKYLFPLIHFLRRLR